MSAIQNCSRKALNVLSKIEWLPPLLARLAVGYLFFLSGKGKLLNLDRTAKFFGDLGIPFPYANAILAASTECFGGILLMAGLLTRLVSIPLAFVMAVAIATAQWGEVKSISDFVGLSELAYLLIFVWLTTAGAGKASLDYLIFRRREDSNLRRP